MADRGFDVVGRRGAPLDERGDPRRYGAGGGLPTPPGNFPGTVQYYPPWIQPPDVYTDFNLQTNVGTAVAANTTITPAETTFKLPAQYRGVIRAVSIFIDSPTLALNVQFILTLDGTPVPGWTRSSFARIATNISIAYNDQHVRLREGQQVGWNIVNNTGVSFTVGVQYEGWLYPSSEETRIMGRLT